jgi:uracil-DNA glycosylase family 4
LRGTRRASAVAEDFRSIEREVVACRRCPRLVAWRESVARNPPRRFAGETYWARPVPAFGDPSARLLVVGLAPAANGGNRTGRVFTGDESGNFLFSALHAAGLANRPDSKGAGDGLALRGALITAAARCAPPDNRPTPEELGNCREYIEREFALVGGPRVLVALGGVAFATCLAVLATSRAPVARPRPRFAHGAEYRIGEHYLLASYHPSQQNTFTGRLTQPMLRAVLRRAAAIVEGLTAPAAAGLNSGPGSPPKPSPSPARLPRRPGPGPTPRRRAPDRPSR